MKTRKVGPAAFPRAGLAVASLLAFAALIPGGRAVPSTPPSSQSGLSYGPVLQGDTDYRFTGSGFAIDDRMVVTTSHSCLVENPTLLAFPGFLKFRAHAGRVLGRVGDITFIDLDGTMGEPSFRLAERGPSVGDRVTILDGSGARNAAVKATAVSIDSLHVENWYEPLRKGSSGSPVLNGAGEVVGMVFAKMTIGNRTLISIYTVEEIRSALAALSAVGSRSVAVAAAHSTGDL
jgi:hypothetical protein